MRVVIDPGHYKDCPNIGRNGYNEGNAMWKLSNYLKDELVRNGIEVKLTRGDDKLNPSLYNRGLMAKGYDLFISEHSNAGGGKGVEVFYSVDLPQDKAYAINMANATAEVMRTFVRGVKTRESEKFKGEDYYGVIDSAQDNGCKHVILVENGFHDNAQEEAFLLSNDNLKKIAIAQAKMTCRFLAIPYKE